MDFSKDKCENLWWQRTVGAQGWELPGQWGHHRQSLPGGEETFLFTLGRILHTAQRGLQTLSIAPMTGHLDFFFSSVCNSFPLASSLPSWKSLTPVLSAPNQIMQSFPNQNPFLRSMYRLFPCLSSYAAWSNFVSTSPPAQVGPETASKNPSRSRLKKYWIAFKEEWISCQALIEQDQGGSTLPDVDLMSRTRDLEGWR